MDRGVSFLFCFYFIIATYSLQIYLILHGVGETETVIAQIRPHFGSQYIKNVRWHTEAEIPIFAGVDWHHLQSTVIVPASASSSQDNRNQQTQLTKIKGPVCLVIFHIPSPISTPPHSRTHPSDTHSPTSPEK